MNKQILISAGIVFLSFNVMAECDTNGTCVWDCSPDEANSHCTATLENGTLTVSGTGNMKNYKEVYDNTDNIAPWYYQRDNITSVIVEEGITSIGAASFECLSSVTKAVLPNTLTSIGNNAFNNCHALTNLDIPTSVETIGNWAFYNTQLSEITLPSNMTKLAQAVLYRVPLSTLVIPENITTLAPDALNYAQATNETTLQSLYCPEHLITQCQEAVKDFTQTSVNITPYQKTPDGQVFYNNKWYATANDITTGNHIKKRIYTVDEADKVTGKVNRVSIKYR